MRFAGATPARTRFTTSWCDAYRSGSRSKIQRHGAEQNTYFLPPCSSVLALFRAGVPPESTSWQRSQKVTIAVPCTAKSLFLSAAAHRSEMRSQMGSKDGHVRGYFERSHARSRGLGTTKSNHTEAR